MIIQPTTEQTRRINRRRTYSGQGFGPRSFECLGLAGLSLSIASGSFAGDTLTSILGATPLAWQFDVSAPGTGTSPTGLGNTLATGTTLTTLKDQSGHGVDWAAQTANMVYSASGGPNGNATISTAGIGYMKCTYAAPAPGTTTSSVYLIARVDTWLLNGALYSANNAQQIAGSSAGKYTARNLTASAEVALTAGVWARVYVSWTNSTADIFKMGSAAAVLGNTAPATVGFGNSAGTTNNFLGVDAAFLSSSFCFGFRTTGALTSTQLSKLDTLYSNGRFSSVAF